MRFLITPNHAFPYDRRMVDGLARGLAAVGHECAVAAKPLSDAEAVAMCRERGVDVLLQVNRLRPADPPLPNTVRHIAWFQDIFPTTLDGIVGATRSSDIIYTLGDAVALGLRTPLPCRVGCLVTGVDESIFDRDNARLEHEVDFSLCGYIPRPVRRRQDATVVAALIWIGNELIDYLPPPLARRWPLPVAQGNALRSVVEELYRPLRGDLDVPFIAAKLHEIAEPFVIGDCNTPFTVNKKGSTRCGARRRRVMERHIDFLSRDYPRLLDRIELVRRVLGVSPSLELYGPGWNTHPEFRRYHRGIIESQEGLSIVYRRTRINLSNNTHGLGMHSRTLECMAVGGFIFMHASPNDRKPGGMLTEFEPGVHFAQYTPETLEEQAERWLRDDVGRIAAGARAADRVRERHLWRHRAEQIVSDLAQ